MHSIIRYFRDSLTELHRVSWPTRAQAVRIALIVLGVTLFFTFIFGVFDSLLALGYAELLKFVAK